MARHRPRPATVVLALPLLALVADGVVYVVSESSLAWWLYVPLGVIFVGAATVRFGMTDSHSGGDGPVAPPDAGG